MGSQTSKATKRPAKRTTNNPKENLTPMPSDQGEGKNRQDDDRHQSRSDEFSSPTSSRHRHHRHHHDDLHSHHHHQHQNLHHQHHEHYPTLTHHDHLHHRRIVINRWPTMDPEALQNNKPKSFYDEYIKP